MSQLIDHLKKEHEAILKQLQKIEENWEGAEVSEDLLKLGKMLHIHHHLEEKYLFQAIYDTQRAQEGGPNCTSFYGLYLQEENYLKSLLKDGGFSLENEEELIRKIFTNKNPLMVPIEEHRACHTLLEKTKKEIQDGNKVEARRNYDKYAHILRLHIRKENECLFMMAQNLIKADLEVPNI